MQISAGSTQRVWNSAFETINTGHPIVESAALPICQLPIICEIKNKEGIWLRWLCKAEYGVVQERGAFKVSETELRQAYQKCDFSDQRLPLWRYLERFVVAWRHQSHRRDRTLRSHLAQRHHSRTTQLRGRSSRISSFERTTSPRRKSHDSGTSSSGRPQSSKLLQTQSRLKEKQSILGIARECQIDRNRASKQAGRLVQWQTHHVGGIFDGHRSYRFMLVETHRTQTGETYTQNSDDGRSSRSRQRP